MKKAGLLVLMLYCAIAQAQVPPGFRDTLLAVRLLQPVGCEFAPDGRLFILQKQGLVRIFKNGRLLSEPALSLEVNDFSERGLLGIAFDPNFTANHYVYIYYTSPGDEPDNRLSRFVVNGDTIARSSERILLKGIRSDSGMHNGGCIKFGKDGKLYVATGDGGANHGLAQNLNSLNGKILRINKDGSVPTDNPFAGQAGKRSEVWCYGLRNPWRFSIDSLTGTMIIADVGGAKFEELNVGLRGANYGWPLAEGMSTDSRFVNPVHAYPHNNNRAAVIGGVFYRGNNFPQSFSGKYFFADAVQGFIKTMGLTSTNQAAKVETFSPNSGRLVHLTVGPDGAIYYLRIWEGELHKIHYASGNNSSPVVRWTSSPRYGALPLNVRFSAEGSVDPDGDALSFQWEFGDGKRASGKIVSHIYQASRNFDARLTVTDSRGLSSRSAFFKVYAGDRPPMPKILQPTTGTTVSPGETMHFSGSASDPEDGLLPSSRLTWNVVLFHDTHTHPYFGPVSGITEGSFTISPNDHLTGNIRYRLYLKATDSRGLTITKYIDLPRQ